MLTTRASFEMVRSVRVMPTITVDVEELAAMALVVVLAMIKDDETNLVAPKKIMMIKEFRDALQGPVKVSLTAEWGDVESSVGLKEAKDAVDSALASLGLNG